MTKGSAWMVPDLEAPESQLGWLAALLDWDRASEAISRVRKHLVSGGLDGEVLIVDASGRVIGGAGRPGGPWRPGDFLDPRLLEADDPESASRIDSAAGMLFGTARLPDTLPLWRVVVAQPLVEAFAPVYRTATLLGTLTAAFNRMAIDLRRAERELVDAPKFAFVGELAAGVAHEVRTPLGVLQSSTQLLERSLDAKDDEARQLLELLRVEIDRIERVVSGSSSSGGHASFDRSLPPSARSCSVPPTSSRPRRARSTSPSAGIRSCRIRKRSAIPSSCIRSRSTSSSTPCYFRLYVFHVKLPPLRQRKEDVADAEAFLAGFARDLGKPALRLAPEAPRHRRADTLDQAQEACDLRSPPFRGSTPGGAAFAFRAARLSSSLLRGLIV